MCKTCASETKQTYTECRRREQRYPGGGGGVGKGVRAIQRRSRKEIECKVP